MSEFSKKLAAIMLFLIERRGSLNRTALNKLCFFADVTARIRAGCSLTSATYEKLPFGPVPAEMGSTRAALVAWSYLSEQYDTSFGYGEYSYKLGNIDLDLVRADPQVGFNEFEMSVIRDVADRLGALSGSALSAASHSFEPWKSASMGSTLSVDAAAKDGELRAWLARLNIPLDSKPVAAG
ncbi:type II toxin-antitoxin system antitoxin SocA domain-containing protein [Dokdonella sp. MW10]|uniref:type II toxin-antitoxin system antitoxin SocA domain-containing protein n=1 Tax=Dokdonella sp. MW10 TaxID=2992926 RepID=UPI003F7FC660